MSIYIYNNKKKTVSKYCTSSKIDKAIETLLFENPDIVGGKTREGYQVSIVKDEDVVKNSPPYDFSCVTPILSEFQEPEKLRFEELNIGDVFQTLPKGGFLQIKIANNTNEKIPLSKRPPNCLRLDNYHYMVSGSKTIVYRVKNVTDKKYREE